MKIRIKKSILREAMNEIELLESVASEKAKKMGLQHVGYGKYKDPKTGKVVAKSSDGGNKLMKIIKNVFGKKEKKKDNETRDDRGHYVQPDDLDDGYGNYNDPEKNRKGKRFYPDKVTKEQKESIDNFQSKGWKFSHWSDEWKDRSRGILGIAVMTSKNGDKELYIDPNGKLVK